MDPVLQGSAARLRVLFLLLLFFTARAEAKTLRVGPEQKYTTIRAAAQAATNGDLILIDPGVYRGDVARWIQSDLVLWAPEGRAEIRAEGASEGNRAIWVVEGTNFTVENIAFSGARNPDREGAALWMHARGKVTIRNCQFLENENGVVGDADSVVIERCVFDRNASGGTSSAIDVRGPYVTIRNNYIRRSVAGTNIRTRAETSHIVANRIMDEDDGRSSYSIDVPDCGLTYIIGNVIEKGVRTRRHSLVSYGGASAKQKAKNLYVINNTLVNNGPPNEAFLRCRNGTRVQVTNNIFFGPGEPWVGGTVRQSHNLVAPYLSTDLGFADVAGYDFRLVSPSDRVVDRGIPPGASVRAYDLTPKLEYVYDAQGKERSKAGALDLGAFELTNVAAPADTLRRAPEPAPSVQRARSPERAAKIASPKPKAKTYPTRTQTKKAKRSTTTQRSTTNTR